MKFQVTLKKSPISSLQVHKDTVAALGLRKIGQTVMKEDNPCIRGQIFRVKHMLDVQEIKEAPKRKRAAPKAKAKAVPEIMEEPAQPEEQQGGNPDETARD